VIAAKWKSVSLSFTLTIFKPISSSEIVDASISIQNGSVHAAKITIKMAADQPKPLCEIKWRNDTHKSGSGKRSEVADSNIRPVTWLIVFTLGLKKMNIKKLDKAGNFFYKKNLSSEPSQNGCPRSNFQIASNSGKDSVSTPSFNGSGATLKRKKTPVLVSCNKFFYCSDLGRTSMVNGVAKMCSHVSKTLAA
jgi:hypothetical protein